MAEAFQSPDDDDIHHTKWRKISRNLIAELNERIIKRRQTLSQSELAEELSQLTSDDESTSVSKGLSDEYHRKKILDAELKLKMLEGIDTVSESSSLSSSMCFQELEVHGEADGRSSVTENINSHNSGGDGRSDSESVSYSMSFTGSIEEDCSSNGDSNSSYVNATGSQTLQVTTDSGVDAMLPSDNLGLTEEDVKSHQVNIEAQLLEFCREVEEKHETDISCFQTSEDGFIEPSKSNDVERGGETQMCSKVRETIKRRRDSDNEVTLKRPYDDHVEHSHNMHFFKFLYESENIHTHDKGDNEKAFQRQYGDKDATYMPSDSTDDWKDIPQLGRQNENKTLEQESIKDVNNFSIDMCEMGNVHDKQLDGFDDIHALFIGQVGELTSHQFMSRSEPTTEEITEKTNNLIPENHDPYRPMLIHRNCQDICRTYSDVKESPPKETKLNQSPFQNISCNKGPSSKEHASKSNTSATSSRRQTLLKDTLNRPLQFCIEKARLVTSIKENFDNARTMKDRVAGKAAYDKAVREFTEAVDKLLVEQGCEAKDDEYSFNDNTYSLDDAKVVRKAAPNPLDALRTPINKRRVAAQQEAFKKKKHNAVIEHNDTDTVVLEQQLSCVEHDQNIPALQRTSTFVVFPAKKCIDIEAAQTTAFGKEDNTVTLNSLTENTEFNTKTIQNMTFTDEIETKIKTREFDNSNRGEFTHTMRSQNDNDDTAYVSDLSPPMDHDKTYIRSSACYFDHVGKDTIKNVEAYNGKNNDNTFEIFKDDKTFAVNYSDKAADGAVNQDNIIEDYCHESSDDETLNIVDSFCNVDNESVDLNDMLPLEDDINSKTSSQTSLEEPWYDAALIHKNAKAPAYIPRRRMRERYKESTFETNEERLIEGPANGQSNELVPTIQNDVDSNNMLNLNPSETDPTTSAVNRNPFGNRTCLPVAEINPVNTKLTSNKSYDDAKTADGTSNKDAYSSIFKDQEIPRQSEDDQIQNDHLNKSRHTSIGLAQRKLEVTQNESSFSISSSTSGEYSLLNQGIQKRTIDDSSSEAYRYQTKTELFREKPEMFYICPANPQDISPFNLKHPPSELLIREKAADNIEEISVENPQIFHELNDIPSAYVMKQHDGSSAEMLSAPDKHQNVQLEFSETKFESSINDLRKTAIGCLGPLREKVAFFENIERALQSHETSLQSVLDEDSEVPKHDISEQPLELPGECSNTATRDQDKMFSPRESVKSEGTNPNIITKDSAVQTQVVSLSEHQEPQMTDLIKALEKGQQFSLFHDALADLIGLVDDLKGKVSETSSLFERLQNSFEDTIQNTRLERERINCSMEALTRRIDSNELVILEKISSIENLIISATGDTGSGFQMVKEELDKLRKDNAEHFDDLKRFSSEISIHKEDLDMWESKVTTEFKEHMDRVQSALEKLQETRPGPSSPPKDADTSKQCCVDDLRIRVIEMKNQRDAEKMYHKITRESMRALERDHDRLRQEVLMAATRRHLTDRRRSIRLHGLTEESSIADIEIPPLTSTPRQNPDTQKKEIKKSTTAQSSSDAKKDKKSKK